MDFVSNQESQIQEMLCAIGGDSIEALFQDIPKNLLLPKPIIDDGISEYEGLMSMERLARKNIFLESYLGGGAYEHHVPAIVGVICSKSEFLTAYTPYQPEASQGMLQVIFEFQSAICALTGMDVSNASLYDAASACAEAILMALRCRSDRPKVLIAGSVHPTYRAVVDQYVSTLGVQIETIPFLENGLLDGDFVNRHLDSSTAAVLLQYPNFFGVIDAVSEVSKKAKAVGALTVLCANPLVYGLYASAKELDVDIAVGDCQPFGIPLQFGGPYAGYMACRQELLRQMPGRIVGETKDTQGRRGFVLTLQAREQHIRREKATSNICTNQALSALASLVAMLWYGKEGIRKLALTNFQRASYLKSSLEAISGVTTWKGAPIFNEFVVSFGKSAEHVQSHFRNHGIEPGLSLVRFYPHLEGYFLVAVTETKSKKQLDKYLGLAKF